MTKEEQREDFVGYVRVSTVRQEEHGFGLDSQTEIIRTWAAQTGRSHQMIFSDAASARGRNTFKRRAGLQDALKRAQEVGVSLVVTNISRLSRDASVLKDLERSGVQIVSIQDGGRVVGKKRLEALIGDAKVDGTNIALRAKEGLHRAKSKGVLLGNRTNLDEARRRGSINNVVRADTKTKELADFLDNQPGWKELKHGDLVKLLNTSGPLNLVKSKVPERKLWTYSSLRQPLLKAIEELDMRAELEVEDAKAGFLGNPAVRDFSNSGQAMSAIEERSIRLREDFKSHPRFGAFWQDTGTSQPGFRIVVPRPVGAPAQ